MPNRSLLLIEPGVSARLSLEGPPGARIRSPARNGSEGRARDGPIRQSVRVLLVQGDRLVGWPC